VPVLPESITWPVEDIAPRLHVGQAHLWAWPLCVPESALEANLSLLSSNEVERANRFKFPEHREAYIVAHARMRQILAGYLNCASESVVFETGTHGKPRLVSPKTNLHFNLTHSHGLGGLAVTSNIEVGLDFEHIRPMEREVAEAHFSADEIHHLDQLSGMEWINAFYRCWTRKEALLKAEGMGLNVPLHSFDVSLLPDQPATLLKTRPGAGFTHSWSLHHLDPCPGYAGALATSEPVQLRCFRSTSNF